MNLDSITALFANVPTDWMIIVTFAIFAAFDCLRSGARRICALALALPVTVVLIESLDATAILGSVIEQFSTPLLGAVPFFSVLALMYILVSRMGLSWSGEAGQTIQAALAGVAVTVIVLVFWIQIPALEAVWHFGPQVQELFGVGYLFWWLLGSYGALAFVRNS